MSTKRFVVKVGGESGQGVNSTGEILIKAFKASGYKTFGYREYPSLIKGGYASFQIDLSEKTINSSSEKCDLLLCLSRVSVHKYLQTLSFGGTLVHILSNMHFSKEEQDFVKTNKIKILFLDAIKHSIEIGGDNLFANIVALAFIWKLCSFDELKLKEFIKEQFASKPKFLEIDLKCLEKGYELAQQEGYKVEVPEIKTSKDNKDDLIMTGNHALSLGSISAGVRAFYAYPMTPASSILSYLSDIYKKTNMVVRQVEDEITAAQMTLGSMFMGTRALTGTSGGGFDLMSETVSAAGMTETPWVCILAQRPGPATGLPTWTSASDLMLAVFPSHGEYPRCVIAASDIESCYLKIQEAFNIAEEYQIPVIVLTEKQIAESYFQFDKLPQAIEIQRHLAAKSDLEKLEPTDRFKITKSGISKRWLPGQSDATFNANTDEHSEDGSIIEDAIPVKQMFDKRMQKMESLKQNISEPKLYGDEHAKTTIVGWGSVKNPILEVIHEFDVNYLHFEYIWPLQADKLLKLKKNGNKLVLIENNFEGQLGKIIAQETGIKIEDKLLKYDGRPFFIEEIIEKIAKLSK